MDIVNTVMGWFSSTSWTEIAAMASIWILAFDRLAKLTPTTKDDSVINWVYKIFAVLGVRVPDLIVSPKTGEIVTK